METARIRNMARDDAAKGYNNRFTFAAESLFFYAYIYAHREASGA